MLCHYSISYHIILCRSGRVLNPGADGRADRDTFRRDAVRGARWGLEYPDLLNDIS